MKICGCNEKCFEVGHEWGHWSQIVCKYYEEIDVDGECVTICRLGGKKVEAYVSHDKYLELKSKQLRIDKLKRLCN